ncbi:hypothetical protein EHP00_82 [Ecytonucleospora hepatopenaei]|uniref:DNA replication complex GINS protein PSF1 n=1 Tax=Ecytonucleospora hepatopenaei TaxID=646526 RepID=A0A1W0E5N1_9MICR|nr:hypothetical protein EHP00_82 [Ecytonucleospora hepatopenaei]
MVLTNFNEIFTEIKNKKLVRYNNAVISNLLEETEYLENQISQISLQINEEETSNKVSVNYALLLKYKERNERLLKTYIYNRIMKIEQLVLNKQEILRETLSLDEIMFEKNFEKLVEKSYMKFFKTISRSPPLDFYTKIMAKEDCGVILTNNEFIDIVKGRMYFIKKSDVKHLFKQDKIEEIL